MPPPGTIIWTWGWWHPRPQYPERRQYRCSGLLPLSPASWCYPADPSQTGAGRWGGLCHGSSRETTEDSDLDAVAGVCRDHDLDSVAEPMGCAIETSCNAMPTRRPLRQYPGWRDRQARTRATFTGPWK